MPAILLSGIYLRVKHFFILGSAFFNLHKGC